MEFKKAVIVAGLALVLSNGMVACTHKEGPAERAGRQIDRSVDNVKDVVEDAGDKVEDATDRHR